MMLLWRCFGARGFSLGGFPSIWHNELRDITAELLTEICCSVGVEPTLQPLTAWRAILLQI